MSKGIYRHAEEQLQNSRPTTIRSSVRPMPESYDPSRETTTMDEPVPSIVERAFLTATTAADGTFAGTDATTTTRMPCSRPQQQTNPRHLRVPQHRLVVLPTPPPPMLPRQRLRILRFIVGVSNRFLPLRKRPERIMEYYYYYYSQETASQRTHN